MKPLAIALNILGFTALFIAYTAAASPERPTGVRRALQTYSCQFPADVHPTPRPAWESRATSNAKD